MDLVVKVVKRSEFAIVLDRKTDNFYYEQIGGTHKIVKKSLDLCPKSS